MIRLWNEQRYLDPIYTKNTLENNSRNLDSRVKHNIRIIGKKSQSIYAKNILIVGVFHGDEQQGEFIIKRFLAEYNFEGLKNNFWFVPCLNTSGKLQNTRVNGNQVDLNRNYPTKNWVKTERNEYFSGEFAASEPETAFMIGLLENIQPAVILTIHAPLKVVNYDGPAKEIAEKISGLCGFPANNDIGYPTPGSFGTYCGIERNIPTITLELDEDESNEKCYERTRPVLEYLAELS